MHALPGLPVKREILMITGKKVRITTPQTVIVMLPLRVFIGLPRSCRQIARRYTGAPSGANRAQETGRGKNSADGTTKDFGRFMADPRSDRLDASSDRIRLRVRRGPYAARIVCRPPLPAGGPLRQTRARVARGIDRPVSGLANGIRETISPDARNTAFPMHSHVSVETASRISGRPFVCGNGRVNLGFAYRCGGSPGIAACRRAPDSRLSRTAGRPRGHLMALF